MKCIICGVELKRPSDISAHANRRRGVSPVEYYTKFMGNPKPVCPICGMDVKFDGIVRGFKKFCSAKCSSSDPAVLEARANTCITKYGGRSSMCSKVVKEKATATMLKKYGVEHALQNPTLAQKVKDALASHTDDEKASSKAKKDAACIGRYGTAETQRLESVKAKAVATCLRKYGGISSVCDSGVREKAKATLKRKYGVEHALQNPEIKAKQVKLPRVNTDLRASLAPPDSKTLWKNRLCKNTRVCLKSSGQT